MAFSRSILLFKKIREYDLRDRVTIDTRVASPTPRHPVPAHSRSHFRYSALASSPRPRPCPLPLPQSSRPALAGPLRRRYGQHAQPLGPYGMNTARAGHAAGLPQRLPPREIWNWLTTRAHTAARPCWACPTTGCRSSWADMVVFPVENRPAPCSKAPMPRFVIKRGVLVRRDGELTDARPAVPGITLGPFHIRERV